MRIAIIGVPWNSLGGMDGEARAPDALRAAGLVDALAKTHEVSDWGNVAFPTPVPTRDAVSGIVSPAVLAAMVAVTRATVLRALAEGWFPLVLGGECSLLLGCLAAARAGMGRVGCCFVDGHEDAYMPHASPTGASADMELALALGCATAPGLEDAIGSVQRQDVVVLGARDREIIRVDGVRSLTGHVTVMDAETVHRTGPVRATHVALMDIIAHRLPWWLHLDFDVLAAEACAAVRHEQPGGLQWEDLDLLMDVALRTPGVIGWDVTNYFPERDPDGVSARRIVSFVTSALDQVRVRPPSVPNGAPTAPPTSAAV